MSGAFQCLDRYMRNWPLGYASSDAGLGNRAVGDAHLAGQAMMIQGTNNAG